MKNLFSFFLLFFLLLSSVCYAQINEQSNNYSPNGTPIRAYLNLNNISTIFKNTGISDIDINESHPGFVFPKGSGKTAVYISGFLWVAYAGNDPQVRVGGSAYREGLQGGRILPNGTWEDPNEPHVRIYRVRPDVYPGGPAVDLLNMCCCVLAPLLISPLTSFLSLYCYWYPSLWSVLVLIHSRTVQHHERWRRRPQQRHRL